MKLIFAIILYIIYYIILYRLCYKINSKFHFDLPRPPPLHNNNNIAYSPRNIKK